jgi:D-inositol-3-phosphate glycosyltransferase
VERQAIHDSCLTVALGDYLVKAVPNADVTTIPNGIEANEWDLIDCFTARRALGIDERAFVVLFVGRIAPVKGVDTLLEAVKSLSHSLPTLRVYVIGSLSGTFDARDDHVDPYAQRLLDAANGSPVRFLGFISNRTIEFRQYLAAADITVVPSRYEPQGNVVLESLVMGTPVIGSDTGGIPDMVSDDVGYLFPPGDVAALAARIKWAHDHPNELLARSSRARARVVAHYSWDDVADRYLAAFHQRINA